MARPRSRSHNNSTNVQGREIITQHGSLLQPVIQNPQTPKIPSTITVPELKATLTNIYFPPGTKISLPSPNSSCYDQFRDGIVVFKDSFDNGLRFPLHSFISAFMRSMTLSIADITPNCWRKFVGFLSFCHRMNITPDAKLFWALFKPRYENRTFWVESLKGLKLSEQNRSARDWRSKWFVVVVPPGTRLGFPRLSLGNWEIPDLGNNKRVVEEHKDVTVLKLVRAADTMVQDEPEFTEWKYLGSKENLKDIGVDNASQGFPDCDAILPEYGFDNAADAEPASISPAVVTGGLKRKRCVTRGQQQHLLVSQPKGGWLTPSDSEEVTPGVEEIIETRKAGAAEILPASTTTTTPTPLLVHNQQNLGQNEIVLQGFIESSNKLMDIVRRKLKENETLSIELAKQQTMISDLQKRAENAEDALERVQIENSGLKKSLVAKESKLAKLRVRFEEEKKLWEMD